MTSVELANEAHGFANPDTACPLCSSEMFSPARQLRDNRTGAFGETFTFARCDGCGLLSLRPQPDPRELAAGYVRGYGPYATDDIQHTVTSPRGAGFRRAWHALDGQATP